MLLSDCSSTDPVSGTNGAEVTGSAAANRSGSSTNASASGRAGAAGTDGGSTLLGSLGHGTGGAGSSGSEIGGGAASGGTSGVNGGGTANATGGVTSGGASGAGRGNGGGGSNTGSGGSSGANGDGGRTSEGNGGSSGTGIQPMTCGPLNPPTLCGNGVVDPGDACDGTALRGLTCPTLDPFFTGGTLGCSNACTLVTTQCTHGTCGNGVIDPGEDCEYTTFPQTFCSALLSGSDGALVACSASTCRYDFSNCAGVPAPVCGNGKREGSEQCDGDDWLWRSCSEHSPDTPGGQLHCNQATCQLDFTQCARCDGSTCGDGVIDSGEECDGTNLNSHSCADQNRLFGTVSCLENCRIDYSQCYGGCTVFKGIITCN